MLASSKSQPYSDVNVGADRENLLNYYYSRGYLNATFDYYVSNADEPAHVHLRYLLKPGARKYVRAVLISGLETTRPDVVYDRLELHDGEPLSLSAETDSQRRLYNLGIFARVNTAVQDPDGDEQDKYVLYDIDEAKHYSFNIGFGAQIARIGSGSVNSLDNPAAAPASLHVSHLALAASTSSAWARRWVCKPRYRLSIKGPLSPISSRS